DLEAHVARRRVVRMTGEPAVEPLLGVVESSRAGQHDGERPHDLRRRIRPPCRVLEHVERAARVARGDPAERTRDDRMWWRGAVVAGAEASPEQLDQLDDP